MNDAANRHFSEQTWEDYAMGKLSEPDCEPMEEHLLICPACQDLLADADEYIEAARTAMTRATPGDKTDQPLVTDRRTRRRLSKAAAASVTLLAAVLP
jgi:hypothetical protein